MQQIAQFEKGIVTILIILNKIIHIFFDLQIIQRKINLYILRSDE